MKIWVDDIRKPPIGYIHFYTVNSVIDFLSKIDISTIEILDLDHDAGEFYNQGGDYIKILDWLEFMKYSIPISIHSRNPAGINNMWRIIKKNNWKYIPQKDEIFY